MKVEPIARRTPSFRRLVGAGDAIPAAAQRLEQICGRGQLRALRFDAVELCVEQGALGDEHVEQARDPVVVAQLRQLHGTLQCVDAQLLRLHRLPGFTLNDEGVQRIFECALDRRPILRKRLLLAGFRDANPGFCAAGVKHGLRGRAGELPDVRRRGEQAGKRRAFPSRKTR